MAILAIKHDCNPHPFQDKKYSGRRVMNETAKPNTYRCTVCGKEQSG